MFIKKKTLTHAYTPSSIEQPYFQRPDLVHCIVVWFMALAFLDNAFEDVSVPAELFGKRNTSGADLLIRIKQSKKDAPIFRRTLKNKCLSETLALTASSLYNDAQRILRDLGCPARFTLYNIRRGVANSMVDSKLILIRDKSQSNNVA